MRILALDLALNVGWAFGSGPLSGTIYGTYTLHDTKSDYGRMSAAFCGWLSDQIVKFKPHLIAVERGFFRGSQSYHLSGLIWDAHRVAHLHEIARVEYPPRSIKKFATGSGKADKDALIAWATDKGYRPKTDHEADALALMELAYSDYERKAA